jgi:cytochrome c oxidase subunit 1
MLVQGMAGFHRRWYNGGDAYVAKAADSANEFGNTVAQMIDLNILMSTGAWLLALAQVPFVLNLFGSLWRGRRVASDNPWHATTLEWATPTPPGHGNFTFEPAVYRGPYEYSRPDHDEDYLPQWAEPKRGEVAALPGGADRSRP